MTKQKQLSKINNDNYYTDTTHITNSMLGYLKESPLHLYYYLKKKIVKESDALSFGNFYDEYLLEPEVFKTKYAIMPDRMRRGTKAYTEWLDDLPEGIQTIRGNEYKTIQYMAEALYNNTDIFEMLAFGEKQKILQWETDGIKCKGKLDNYIPGEAIVDLKTAKEANIDYWKSAVKYNYHYDRQASYYQHGEGNKLDFFWVIQEKKAPYIPMLVKASKETLLEGHKKWKSLLKRYKELFVDNKFNPNKFVNYYEL